ncbi:MAG: bifunctional lysine ketoglutarate reductase /saccharopine dehydrogenase family protein [Deltaproteobacteria bacterium]|nr:bifunctional lysine ketoglutarate reductase /saccharopine dehydrogenase family protein [Deltaproteobacteria bacterium]
MTLKIGIRKEDKNVWERRAPLTPHAVAELKAKGVEVRIERFEKRAFIDEDYEASGARLVDDMSGCDVVMGIKEIPVKKLEPGRAYVFFSHTIKGQHYNMAMLRRLVELKCTLVDYELVKDGKGRRLIFFGRYAGLAGMIDTLWTLGQRLLKLGLRTPFADIEPAHGYPSLEAARHAIAAAGRRIAAEGLPGELAPMVFGFTGYGNVSQGAQEIFDVLPHDDVSPVDLPAWVDAHKGQTKRVAKAVYHEKHMVAPIDPAGPFELHEYFDHPERYRSTFEPHLALLSVIVNGIFWTEKYPRLATREQLKELFASPARPRLLVVGDISCDVDGSLACTVRDTEPGNPVYVYDPATGEAPSGFDGPGLAVMAVGNLPCELPMESSTAFSAALMPFMPALASMDMGKPFAEVFLPDELRRAVILWRGELTPGFEYMREFLKQ